MFVLNKAHARAFQGRIHQKFSKGGRGQNFFRWRLKANKKKRSRELLHFLDFYKNNEKVYEIKPKKKIKRVEGGGGVKGSALD